MAITRSQIGTATPTLLAGTDVAGTYRLDTRAAYRFFVSVATSAPTDPRTFNAFWLDGEREMVVGAGEAIYVWQNGSDTSTFPGFGYCIYDKIA